MAPVANPPVVLMLPVDDLVIPELNPRKTVKEGPLQDLMAHIQAGGHVDRILVWGGDRKSVISGQRRLLAYRRLGKTHIEAEILDINLEEARKKANTANQGEPLYWLEKYVGWEPYLSPDSGLSDEQAAAAVGTSDSSIRRARTLLAMLNPVSRKFIREKLEESQSQGDSKNKGNNEIPQALRNTTETLKKRISENTEGWELLEDVAYPLTGFWDKRSIQEAQALVEKALPFILSREMNGPQVKALVTAMKAGTPAEAYVPAPPKPKTPKAAQPTPSTGSQTPGEPDLHSQVGAAIAGHVLGKKLHLPSNITNQLRPWLSRQFQKVKGLLERMGVNKLAATLFTLFLILFVVSILNSRSRSLFRGLWNGFAYRCFSASPERTKVVEGGSTSNSQRLTPNSAKSVQSANLQVSGQKRSKAPKPEIVPSWASVEAGFATEFAGRFYGMNLQNWTDNLLYFKAHTTQDYLAPFIHRYFPKENFTQARQQNLAFAFLNPQWKFERMDGDLGVFLVQGNQTKTGNGVSPTTRIVGLILWIQHNPDGQSLVEKALDVSPDDQTTNAGSAKGLDPLKAVGDGVKDYQNAVGTAGDVKTATDKVKGLFQ